jgi:hypothetical protein
VPKTRSRDRPGPFRRSFSCLYLRWATSFPIKEVHPLISLAYLICRLLFYVLVSANRRVDAKDVEIVVLRHQLDVLARKKGKPRFSSRDKVLLAALSRLLPRDR